MISYEGWATQK